MKGGPGGQPPTLTYIIMKKFAVAEKMFVFGEDKYFKSCHASTVAYLPGAGICAAAFGGTAEGRDDVGIFVSMKGDKGFLPPTKIKISEEAHWNPVLSALGGKFTLWFKAGKTIPGWVTYVAESSDGVNWTEPQPLVPGDISGGRGPVKNPPLPLPDGTLIGPRSVETHTAWTTEFDISFDGGKSWHITKPLDYKYDNILGEAFKTQKRNGIIQPALWRESRGVHAFMRSTWGAVYRSDSENGIDWSPAYRTEIPNNNSGICCAVNSENILALCLNPVSTSERTPLKLLFSSDGGDNFDDGITLEDGEGEYSYPTVVADGSDFLVTYTYKRRDIVFCRVSAV